MCIFFRRYSCIIASPSLTKGHRIVHLAVVFSNTATLYIPAIKVQWNSQGLSYSLMISQSMQYSESHSYHNGFVSFHPPSREVPLSSARMERLLSQQHLAILDDHSCHDVRDVSANFQL